MASPSLSSMLPCALACLHGHDNRKRSQEVMKLGSSEWMFLIFIDSLFLTSALPIFADLMLDRNQYRATGPEPFNASCAPDHPACTAPPDVPLPGLVRIPCG
jgi:hypothetical protein